MGMSSLRTQLASISYGRSPCLIHPKLLFNEWVGYVNYLYIPIFLFANFGVQKH